MKNVHLFDVSRQIYIGKLYLSSHVLFNYTFQNKSLVLHNVIFASNLYYGHKVDAAIPLLISVAHRAFPPQACKNWIIKHECADVFISYFVPSKLWTFLSFCLHQLLTSFTTRKSIYPVPLHFFFKLTLNEHFFTSTIGWCKIEEIFRFTKSGQLMTISYN